MKTIKLVLVALLFSVSLWAQTPTGIGYQGVVRNSSGALIANTAVGVKVSFLQGSATGTSVYEEIFNPNPVTNVNGLLTLEIGTGTPILGSFSGINWVSANYFYKVEIDPNGGNNYTINSTSKYLIPPVSGISRNSPVYVINSSNYLTTIPGPDKIVNVQGIITLSANYNNLNNSNQFISGGQIDGQNANIIYFGTNCVISNVNFQNLAIDGGANVQFNNCKFLNVTSLPFQCKLSGCQIINSIFTTSSSIGYVSDSFINQSTIPRINYVTNSLIANSTLGNTNSSLSSVVLASNNQINNSSIYLTGNFTGNTCDDTWLSIRGYSPLPMSITGNSFSTTFLTSFVDVNLNSSSKIQINFSGNNLIGSLNYPNTNFIRVFGSYTSTRCIVKVANNNVTGGNGAPFISADYSGSADLMVNDNDLLYTGGVGVTNGGFIYVRNNTIH